MTVKMIDDSGSVQLQDSVDTLRKAIPVCTSLHLSVCLFFCFFFGGVFFSVMPIK